MLAAAQGRLEEALDQLRFGANLAGEYTVDHYPQVVLELIRVVLQAGSVDATERYREILGRGRSPFAQGCLRNVEGLLAEDPADAIGALRDAVERFEALGTRVDLARALLDLGRAERRAGEDPRPTFERARALLVECDAQLFVREADEELGVA